MLPDHGRLSRNNGSGVQGSRKYLAELGGSYPISFFYRCEFPEKTGMVSRISPKIYPFVMALLSGYPMGARITGDYYRAGLIDRDQMNWILSYSMVTGPAFLVGAVGVGFLGSHRLGLVLCISHYGGALSTARSTEQKKRSQAGEEQRFGPRRQLL